MKVLGLVFAAALAGAHGAPAAAAQAQREGQKAESKSGDDARRAKLRIGPGQRYLLLSTLKTSTMQKELDEAAAEGFRVVTGSPTSTNEWAVLLERVAEPSAPSSSSSSAATRGRTAVGAHAFERARSDVRRR